MNRGISILIDNRQDAMEIDFSTIESFCRSVLIAVDEHDGELSLSFVDDAEIAELNANYRHKEGPTDVLSFPMRDPGQPSQDDYILGDVVISVPTAKRQAYEFGHALVFELARLCLHGILHLTGHDHIEDAEAERMERLEKELLAKVREMIPHRSV